MSDDGYTQPVEDAPMPNPDLKSLDKLVGNTLTIWGGQKGSPAYFTGQFSDDGDTLIGGWVYPGGGTSRI